VSNAGATIVGMSDAPIQHAFVSYVREDADEVGKLVSVLQAASIPVWKDTENLWPGEDCVGPDMQVYLRLHDHNRRRGQ